MQTVCIFLTCIGKVAQCDRQQNAKLEVGVRVSVMSKALGRRRTCQESHTHISICVSEAEQRVADLIAVT